jgi:hypothetical protein
LPKGKKERKDTRHKVGKKNREKKRKKIITNEKD